MSPHAGAADVDRAVAAARTAFDHGPWPRTGAGGARRGHGDVDHSPSVAEALPS